MLFGKEEKPMPFSPALPMPYAHERYLGRPSCPHCGEIAIAAEAMEYVRVGRVRYSWHCDGCMKAFDTTVDLGLFEAR
jgi:hypothetical protein